MFLCLMCTGGADKRIKVDGVKKCPLCKKKIVKTAKGDYPLTLGAQVDSATDGFLPPGYGRALKMLHPDESASEEGKVIAKFLLQYPTPIDIPGTGYNLIRPVQDQVSKSIVAEKVEQITAKRSARLLPAVYVSRIDYGDDDDDEVTENKAPGEYPGLILAEDGHHTFVAALKSGSPIWLFLTKSYVVPDHDSWKKCTYGEFMGRGGTGKGSIYVAFNGLPQ